MCAAGEESSVEQGSTPKRRRWMKRSKPERARNGEKEVESGSKQNGRSPEQAPLQGLPNVTKGGACPECSSLKAEILRLSQLKDAALLDQAKVREMVNALQLNYPTSSHDLGPYAGLEPEERPLRYELADFINDLIKKRLSLLHRGARVLGKTAHRLAHLRGTKGDSAG